MKKALMFLLISLLVMTLCVGLVSCGGSDDDAENGGGNGGGTVSQNLTIDQFTSAMKSVDENFALRNMGGHYLYENDSYSSFTCKVYCDADDYIKYIEINSNDIPERKVSTADDILNCINKPSNDMTGEETRVASFFSRLSCLIKMINKNASSMTESDLANIMSASVEPATYGTWKLEVYHSLNGVQFIASRPDAE